MISIRFLTTFWDNLSIGKRVSLGFVIVILSFLAASVQALLLANEVKGNSAQIRSDNVPGTLAIAEVATQSLRSHLRLVAFAGSKDAKQRDQHLVKGNENMANAEKAFSDYEAT